ncbi:hypothetical protein R0131_14350 [Clostridium sp. AL.422]|uniref:hypothetical protein n=1 Tax=Clostridium TaxID=1485 RepID=UPI00293DD481|nr:MULTISPECIES: hypothetical protein [unclassified Clostridium]MDV4152006.1 hypothetical protein [Clostridium sp. AL.422]
MGNKKLLLTLGAGYMCTQISNVKKVKIEDDLNLHDNDKNNKSLSIFILNNNIYENLLVLNFNKEENKVKIANLNMERGRLSKVYNEDGEIETIKLLNSQYKLSINNFIKFDYNILADYVDKIKGIDLKITPREARLLNLEESQNCTYNFTGKALIEYLNLNYKGVDKNKRLKKIFKELIDRMFECSTKEFLNIISDIVTNIETSLGTKELVTLGIFLLKMETNNIEEYELQLNEIYV